MSTQTQPTYEELQAENIRLREELNNVLTQFQELKRHVFGRKTEKLSVINDGQLALFAQAPLDREAEPEIEVAPHRRAKRNGRTPLPADLPRERKEYEPGELNCSCCGSELEKIGEEVSEELEYTHHTINFGLWPKREKDEYCRAQRETAYTARKNITAPEGFFLKSAQK